MARQSPDRRNAEDPADAEVGDLDILDDDTDDPETTRDSATDSLWADLRVEPVEIALPGGTGYTLRAYRAAGELTAPTVEREPEEDLFAPPRRPVESDEDTVVFEDFPEAGEEEPEPSRRRGWRGRGKRRGDEAAEVADPDAEADADSADRDADSDDPEAGPTDADDTPDDEVDTDGDADSDEDESDERDVQAADTEEVPVFLGHAGQLYLFRSPESLVEFVRSGADNDLAQLDTWADLVERLTPADIVVVDDDTYELDLVVRNLRGGHDSWDPELIISAGELARDVGYALRETTILTAMAPGSPLDDLDEALRGTVSGGLGGFLARRRVKKIGAEQATLGWRTIIGKISSVVVWRD